MNPRERAELREVLFARTLSLSHGVWRNGLSEPEIQTWLDNFTGDVENKLDEQIRALHLLSEFTYFGLREIRVLLKTLYTEHIVYPLLGSIRRSLGMTRDLGLIEARFSDELAATRFLGMGNPSESGSHLLYYFRQENELPKGLFINPHEIFDGPATDAGTTLRDPKVKRYVFLDDLLGSGQQATEYSETLLQDVRTVALRSGHSVELVYLVMFAKPEGLAKARSTDFDRVCCVHELGETDKAFGVDSRVFRNAGPVLDLATSKSVALNYGRKLRPSIPLGYGDGQLLIGFHHNIPDNSLPIFWHDLNPHWVALMPRHRKV